MDGKKDPGGIDEPIPLHVIDPRLAEPHELAGSEEQFIQAGMRLIQESGGVPENVVNNLKAGSKELPEELALRIIINRGSGSPTRINTRCQAGHSLSGTANRRRSAFAD